VYVLVRRLIRASPGAGTTRTTQTTHKWRLSALILQLFEDYSHTLGRGLCTAR